MHIWKAHESEIFLLFDYDHSEPALQHLSKNTQTWWPEIPL